MSKKLVCTLAVMMLAVLACSFGSFNTQTVRGSGKVASETRSVSGFNWIELKGSADVNVTFGAAESVVVEADDNILPLIQTSVNNGRLVINNKLFTSISTSNPIRVNVTMKSMQGITLSGSGNISATGLVGKDLTVDLPGSGEITVNGTADHVSISMPGSGNIFCASLKSPSANVTLSGSGNVNVFASESLDASISGSGTIRYGGNPAQLTTNVSGSGSITK